MQPGGDVQADWRRPALLIAIVMNLVLSSLVLRADAPRGDVVHRSPPALALNYAGAPPASFAELVGIPRADPPAADRTAPQAGPSIPVDPPKATCEDDRIFGHHCDGIESAEYVTNPAGVWFVAENHPAGMGGQLFRTPAPVLTLTVQDRGGQGVPVAICQRYGPRGEGEACLPSTADVLVEFCSTPDPIRLTGRGFRPGYVRVFVDATSNRCPMPGTTGTITLTWGAAQN